VGRLEGKKRLEDLAIDGGMISYWMSDSEVGGWTGLIWLRSEQMAGCCECRNEPSCSIKCGEYVD